MNGSVLIIDDDAAFRFAMAKALRRGGHRVSEASSGEEAVEVLRNGAPPDVALLDLKMKGIGGLEVLRRIAGHEEAVRAGALDERFDIRQGCQVRPAQIRCQPFDQGVCHAGHPVVLPASSAA